MAGTVVSEKIICAYLQKDGKDKNKSKNKSKNKNIFFIKY
jgi:hypothetical protein